MRWVAALALALSISTGAAGAAALGPDPASVSGPMSVGRLPGGGAFLVRPTEGPALAAVELWYRAPSTGFGTVPVPLLSRVAAQTVAASTPITGRDLSRVVADGGGRLSINAYPDAISISALVPASLAPAIVRTMTAVYFTPVISAAGLRRAQISVTAQTLRDSFDPDAIMRESIFESLFTQGPAHYPAASQKPDAAKISLEDVRAYAQRAFRAENAVLVVTGVVHRSIAASAVPGRAPAGAAETPFDSIVAASPTPVHKDFYEPGLGLGWLGPPIADERAATAMDFIADYLTRQNSGTIASAVSALDGEASVFGQFITLHNPGVLVIQITASDRSKLDQKKMRSIVDEHIVALQKPLSPAAFAAARDQFAYHLLSDLQTPLELADNLGWYTVEGDALYAPTVNGQRGAYFAAIAALTPQIIADVARKYLAVPGAVVALSVPTPAPAASPKGTP